MGILRLLAVARSQAYFHMYLRALSDTIAGQVGKTCPVVTPVTSPLHEDSDTLRHVDTHLILCCSRILSSSEPADNPQMPQVACKISSAQSSGGRRRDSALHATTDSLRSHGRMFL